MVFDINTLLDKILFELKNPLYCRQLDDPRIDTYYISINQSNFIVLYGVCGECDGIIIYNKNNIKYNIMTPLGIDKFVNTYEPFDYENMSKIFELKLDSFNGNLNDVILHLTNEVKNIVSL